MTRHTLDLHDEIARLEDRISQIKQEAAEANRGSDEWNSLDAQFKSLSGRLRALDEAANQWGETEFVIKDLTFGDLMMAKDEVQRQSFERVGNDYEGMPRDGYYRITVLDVALVDGPGEAPWENPEELPFHVGEWIYDTVDALNTVGEKDMGNCSLADEMDSR